MAARERDDYCEAKKLRAVYGLKHLATVGPSFINEVNGVLLQLREYYRGRSKYNAKGEVGGDEGAFLSFVHRMQKAVVPKKAALSLDM